MRARLLALLVAAAAPLGALADRGAFSLEAGGVLAGVRAPPAVGTGDSVAGTLAGVTIGARYALSNSFEVIGTIDWFAPSWFYNDNTVIVTGSGTFTGQLQSRLNWFSAKVGAQYVHGHTWRVRLGAQVGWTRLMWQQLDLVDLTPPPRSFGLDLGSRSVEHLVVAGLAGVEWEISDHVSIAVTPRVEFPLGSGLAAITVPLTVAYSWYIL